MLNIITWIRQVPQHRNFQLLLASIFFSILWVTIFSLYFIPLDIPDTGVALVFAGGGIIIGATPPAIDSAESVASIAVLRYMFWLAAGSVIIGIAITMNPFWLGAGVSGGIIGYSISMGSRSLAPQNESQHIVVVWNIFLLFWLLGLCGLVIIGLRGETPAFAGLVVAIAVLVSQHQTFADEVGVSYGS